MARRRYYYRRTVRPKQKWAINTVDANVSSETAKTIGSSGSAASIGTVVCQNSTRVSTSSANQISSAQILKTGRWKFKGYISTPSGSVSYIVYLVYVPEGYYGADQPGNYDISISYSSLGEDIFYRHPEWVLAWTRKDYVTNNQINEISISSRLKRNLNSGDQVQMRCMIINTSSEGFTLNAGFPLIRGTVSYCCRAN